jgi:hypothetical protein
MHDISHLLFFYVRSIEFFYGYGNAIIAIEDL